MSKNRKTALNHFCKTFFESQEKSFGWDINVFAMSLEDYNPLSMESPAQEGTEYVNIKLSNEFQKQFQNHIIAISKKLNIHPREVIKDYESLFNDGFCPDIVANKVEKKNQTLLLDYFKSSLNTAKESNQDIYNEGKQEESSNINNASKALENNSKQNIPNQSFKNKVCIKLNPNNTNQGLGY